MSGIPCTAVPKSSCACGPDSVVNAADTSRAASIVTWQLPVPLHAPPQPLKLMPTAVAAVSVTCVPYATAAEQVVPQWITAGLLVTVPLPVFVTRSMRGGGGVLMLCTLAAATRALSSRQGPCAGCGGAVIPAVVTFGGA
jgi:hypothetical protein